MIYMTFTNSPYVLLAVPTLALLACSDDTPSKLHVDQNTLDDTPATNDATDKSSYKTIEWADLIPADDLEALMNPPASLDEIEDGSAEDQISSQIQSAEPEIGDSRYHQALASTRVIEEFNHQRVRVPGFIVPLESSDEKIVTTFFLVPFFGACIHEPPPPPNQIIYAEFEPGMKLEALYDPFWIEGILSTSLMENDVATAAYSIEVQTIEPYVE